MTDPDESARVVLRHNTFSNSASASHGQDTSPEGCRHWEFYDNVWIFTLGTNNGKSPDSHGYPLNLNYWFYVRGGTGVITGNVIPDIKSEYWSDKPEISLTVQNINRIANSVPCQTSYPAARQVGQTWVGTGGSGFPTRGTSKDSGGPDGMHYGTDPIYIWGNTGSAIGKSSFVGITQYSPDDCKNGQSVGNYIKAGRDYVMDVPKPGWTRYTYPHPLRKAVAAAARQQ